MYCILILLSSWPSLLVGIHRLYDIEAIIISADIYSPPELIKETSTNILHNCKFAQTGLGPLTSLRPLMSLGPQISLGIIIIIMLLW